MQLIISNDVVWLINIRYMRVLFFSCTVVQQRVTFWVDILSTPLTFGPPISENGTTTTMPDPETTSLQNGDTTPMMPDPDTTSQMVQNGDTTPMMPDPDTTRQMTQDSDTTPSSTDAAPKVIAGTLTFRLLVSKL